MRKFPSIFLFLPLAAFALAACGAESANPFAPNDPAQGEASALELDPERVDGTALKAKVTEAEARRFYEARGWQPVWDTALAADLLAALADSERHALSKATFLKLSPSAALADKEAALTHAALGYASALARGSIDPAKLFPVYTLPRPQADLAGGLARAIAGETVAEWFASLAPRSVEYKALSDAYLHYLKVAAREGAGGISGGTPIEPGMRDPRVPQLADALRGNGYLQGETPTDANIYTPAMAQAVKRLQADYGIEADAIVGPDTLQVLNTSAQDKARQLAVNLERRRWLERNPAATRIDVNTAATTLYYWRDGQLRDQRRVVVGQPDWETPQLHSPIFQLVANPSWTVPKSIEEEEIAPKGAAYLWRNNMVRRDGRIVQLPGPDNALGQVKLDMRNGQAIYLHDTPAKALFAENERHRSHGCVRVENAVAFARMLAGDHGVLPRFDRELANGDEGFVKLNKEFPVRLLYHTAFLDGGKVAFRADAYGWDERVAVALGMAERTGRRFRSTIRDVGP